ncbi:unnamed protein product, partial [Prorocentrum cordatum]
AHFRLKKRGKKLKAAKTAEHAGSKTANAASSKVNLTSGVVKPTESRNIITKDEPPEAGGLPAAAVEASQKAFLRAEVAPGSRLAPWRLERDSLVEVARACCGSFWPATSDKESDVASSEFEADLGRMVRLLSSDLEVGVISVSKGGVCEGAASVVDNPRFGMGGTRANRKQSSEDDDRIFEEKFAALVAGSCVDVEMGHGPSPMEGRDRDGFLDWMQAQPGCQGEPMALLAPFKVQEF